MKRLRFLNMTWLLLAIACVPHEQAPQSLRLYVGTYTDAGSEGIYTYRLDLATGALTHEITTAGITSPAFLAFSPGKKFLYAVNEMGEFQGKSSGAVSAFSVNQETGALTLLNQQPSQGAHPCHISVDATGKWVLAANYTGGNVIMFPVQADGSLGEASDMIKHEGSGPNAARQKGPHAHSINLDPGNQFVYAADLGIDKIMIYRLDKENGKLAENSISSARVAPGAGPRHLTFHPNGKFVYVINELNASITAFAFNSENGGLSEIETVSTLPDDWTGNRQCADIHIHPSGRFLYGSNRGHDSIVIYRINQNTGKLTHVGYQTEKVVWPRNFAIEPSGTYLLVANKDANNVVTFKIDQETGELQDTGYSVEVSKPVCIVF